MSARRSDDDAAISRRCALTTVPSLQTKTMSRSSPFERISCMLQQSLPKSETFVRMDIFIHHMCACMSSNAGSHISTHERVKDTRTRNNTGGFSAWISKTCIKSACNLRPPMEPCAYGRNVINEKLLTASFPTSALSEQHYMCKTTHLQRALMKNTRATLLAAAAGPDTGAADGQLSPFPNPPLPPSVPAASRLLAWRGSSTTPR